MEYKELNNGIKMPSLGIGTFMLEPDVAEDAVCNALKNGYRLIDTANAYVNEKAVELGKVKSIGLSNFNEERFFFTMSEEEQERAFLKIKINIKENTSTIKATNKVRAKLHEYRGSWVVDSYLILEKDNNNWIVKEILI